MAALELEKLTWEDVDSLDRSRTIVFLPVSPLEEHGPQLPVGTDFLAAKDLAALAVRILEQDDPSLSYLVHPGIPLGCAAITSDFPGTLSLGGKAMARVVFDSCASLAKHGFKWIVISNHHYEPAHVKAIHTASRRLWRRYRQRVADPLGLAAYSGQHPVDDPGLDLSREMHGDFEETSFIMLRHPDLLKGVYRELPPVHLNLALRYAAGMRTLRKMGAARGYVGSPAAATSEYGQKYYQSLGRLLAEGAMKLFRNEKLPEMGLQMKLVLKLVRLS